MEATACTDIMYLPTKTHPLKVYARPKSQSRLSSIGSPEKYEDECTNRYDFPAGACVQSCCTLIAVCLRRTVCLRGKPASPLKSTWTASASLPATCEDPSNATPTRAHIMPENDTKCLIELGTLVASGIPRDLQAISTETSIAKDHGRMCMKAFKLEARRDCQQQTLTLTDTRGC